MTGVRVQVLGSGGPFAPGGRHQACIVLESDAGRVLLDCGATALLSLARAGIDPASIDAVVVTHFHGDHIGGLPFLIAESQWNLPWSEDRLPRRTPLVIAGPLGTAERVQQVTALFDYGAAFTAMNGQGLLRFQTLTPQRPTTVGPVTVTAYPVPHTAGSVALRVGFGNRVIAYSGDAAWTDTLLTVAERADLFVCAAYAVDHPMDSILTYRTLQAHRSRLTCTRLLLTHVGRELHDRRADIAHEVEIAEDGLVLEV